MVLLQLKDLLELFVKEEKYLPGSAHLSRLDMTLAVESDVKTVFLISFLQRAYVSMYNVYVSVEQRHLAFFKSSPM